MSNHNNYVVNITRLAKNDLLDITAYTTFQWGETQAVSYLNDIYQVIFSLEHAPNGREWYGIPSAIKGISVGKHVVFYRIEKENVYILRILHQSMDHGRHV